MAIASMLYVIALIIVTGVGAGGQLQTDPATGKVPPGDYVDFSWTHPQGVLPFMRALPMIVFCFGCQPQVPPLYAELQRKVDVGRNKGSAARLRGFSFIILGSVGTFGCLVLAMGTFGVLAFPNHDLYHNTFDKGDILKVFDANSHGMPAYSLRAPRY